MGNKGGKPKHKYAHMFASYYERTLLPNSDPMHLEPRDVKQQLDMPEGTYYKYKKEYEASIKSSPIKTQPIEANAVDVNTTVLVPIMPGSWDDFYRQYVEVIQSYLIYVNENMEVYREALDLIKRTKRLIGRTDVQTADALQHCGKKLELMYKRLREYMVNNNIKMTENRHE